MKTLKDLFLSLLMGCALLMAGCSDDDDTIWDFANSSISFDVVDQSYNSLLNSKHPNNVLDNDIYISYKDKEFRCVAPNAPTPRFNMPYELALRLQEDVELSPILNFGEFSPTEDYKSESFTVYWGDGRKTEIKFDLYITWKKKEPTVHRNLYVDGQHFFEHTPEMSITGFPIVKMILE